LVEGKMPEMKGTRHIIYERMISHQVLSAQGGRGVNLQNCTIRYCAPAKQYSELESHIGDRPSWPDSRAVGGIGHPIAGDLSARSNPLKRLALHAHYLAIRHPTTIKLPNFRVQFQPLSKKLF
jgi:hypothetical protein